MHAMTPRGSEIDYIVNINIRGMKNNCEGYESRSVQRFWDNRLSAANRLEIKDVVICL